MHIEQYGDGPDLVLVHGWSFHSGVWQPLLQTLTASYRVHLIDLPGHGRSDWQAQGFALDKILVEWQQRLPDNAIWLAWSLGGLLSIAMADRYPEKVSKLILLAATPCFVQRDDWTTAMTAEVFEAFAASLCGDVQQTLQRFILLQAKGAEQSRDTIQQLSEQLSQQRPADPQALQAGLKVLQEADLRAAMVRLQCPLQFILGERDNLVPVSLAHAVPLLQPTSQVSVIARAGHAPLLSHPQQCQSIIESFIYG